MKTITTTFEPDRNAPAIPCPTCGAYAPEAEGKAGLFTKAEIASEWNCGRRWACCIVAFKCPKCKVRILAKQAAPECD
jgi:DNA-directed RNA polymerase subunit RPC12/RpoP